MKRHIHWQHNESPFVACLEHYRRAKPTNRTNDLTRHGQYSIVHCSFYIPFDHSASCKTIANNIYYSLHHYHMEVNGRRQIQYELFGKHFGLSALPPTSFYTVALTVTMFLSSRSSQFYDILRELQEFSISYLILKALKRLITM